MTDQNYQLVPVEPTQRMLEVMNMTGCINSSDCHLVYMAAIAAAPEPVCRWEHVSGFPTSTMPLSGRKRTMSSLPYDVARLVHLVRNLNPDCPTIGPGTMAQLKEAADRVHATITGDHHAQGTQR